MRTPLEGISACVFTTLKHLRPAAEGMQCRPLPREGIDTASPSPSLQAHEEVLYRESLARVCLRQPTDEVSSQRKK